LRGEEGRQMREKVLELANSGLEQALTEDSVCSISLPYITIDALPPPPSLPFSERST
jgi:hypothetical protein